MNTEARKSIKSFLLELAVYAVLVVIYFFLVLHLMGSWLYHLFKNERKTYAVVALLLIVGQGVLLEILTTGLLRIIKPKVGQE
ncbi:MAG TPA: hypothetical protein VHH88_09000 [Verrucomicrobiae bacterium]|nr:hypothetical protein [Verrucomicrobiae bacterium]